MIKTLIVAGLLSTTMFSGHANADLSHCGVDHSRFNPVELSDYQECWLDEFRGDDTSGVMGSLFWVNINDKYYSAPISTLRWDMGEAFKQSIVDDQISVAQQKAIRNAIAELEDRINTADEVRNIIAEDIEDLEKYKELEKQYKDTIDNLNEQIADLKTMLDPKDGSWKEGFDDGVASVSPEGTSFDKYIEIFNQGKQDAAAMMMIAGSLSSTTVEDGDTVTVTISNEHVLYGFDPIYDDEMNVIGTAHKVSLNPAYKIVEAEAEIVGEGMMQVADDAEIVSEGNKQVAETDVIFDSSKHYTQAQYDAKTQAIMINDTQYIVSSTNNTFTIPGTYTITIGDNTYSVSNDGEFETAALAYVPTDLEFSNDKKALVFGEEFNFFDTTPAWEAGWDAGVAKAKEIADDTPNLSAEINADGVISFTVTGGGSLGTDEAAYNTTTHGTYTLATEQVVAKDAVIVGTNESVYNTTTHKAVTIDSVIVGVGEATYNTTTQKAVAIGATVLGANQKAVASDAVILSSTMTDTQILATVEFDEAIETALDEALDSHSTNSDEWKKGFAVGYGEGYTQGNTDALCELGAC